MQTLFIFYLIVINAYAFYQFGVDKSRAINHQWRISEKRLMRTALLGGAVGSWLGMKTFHHKTLHPKFRSGLPLIVLSQFYWEIRLFDLLGRL